MGLLPAGLLDRFYLRLGDFRRLRRLSDAVVLFLVWFGYILAVALLPLFLLPLLLPLPAAAESREQINDMFSGPPLSFFVLLSLKGHLKFPKSFISFKGLLIAHDVLF